MAVYTVDSALTASDSANNQFKTIQEAIYAARGANPQSEDDRITIEIKASAVEYTGENVAGMSNSVLNLEDAKFITLAGAGAGNTVFRGQINVANSEGITIENMTITADGTNSAELTGHVLIDARQQGVKDLIIRNNVIALENCDHASEVKYDVIDLYTQTGSKENVTISGNTISGGCYSIRLDRFNNGATVIADNVITGSQRAINVDGMTGTVEITGNSISNVLHKGIQIAGTAAESVTISENTIQVIGKDDGSAALVYHETLNTTSDFAVTDNSLVVTTQGMPVIREEGSVVSPTQTNNYMQNADGTLADGSAEPETSVAEFLVSADWSEITSGVVSYNEKFYTIGTNAFGSLSGASAALNGADVEIVLAGDKPILADAVDFRGNVTLSGNAVIQRNNKNLLIGYEAGDAKLTIAKGSELDFTNNGTETDGQGIIVSDGRTENGVTDRYHGELFIDNAYVKASYFINRNITTISGDGVAVSNTANFSSSNGFYIGSRPESETGDTNVATVTINNKAFVDASGTNEVLVGYEGAGMLVVNDAKFVADRQNVDVASGSSIQLVNAEFSARSIENAGTVNVSGNSKLAITELTGSAVNIQDGATLTDSNVGNVGGYVWIMGTATLAGDNAFTGVNLYGGSDAVLNIGADAALAVTNDICMRDGSKMNVYGTISAKALSIGGSTLTVNGGSLEAYVEDYHADKTAQVSIVNGGSVTLTNAYRGLNVSIDTASTLTLTGTVYGDFTFNVTHTGEGDVFAKIVDVVNDNVSIDFSVAVANNSNLVVFGNDLYYSNLDVSVYIVDSEFDSDVVGYGIDKFSNITDAVKAAEANGGATINLTDEAYSGSPMGPANAGLFQTNGTYTFTGGNYIDFVYVETPRPTTDNAGTVDVNIVFDKAKVTAGKFRLDNGASLTIKDSFVDAQIANGASVGWTTFYGDSTIRVENSVIGWYNTAQTVESSAITAGDRETNYYNVAPYGTAIGDMCYLGSGVMETVGSTVFTYVSEASDRTALGVYDRGLMSFTDSAVYAYTLRVGMSSSNKTVGRDDEVATMIFDNSTLRNSLGEAGERIFVGDGGDTAGTLIIRNNSVVDKAGAAMTVANNGIVWITDSELNVKSLSNAGTVNQLWMLF